jgi:GAF domain-containing protein
MHIAPLPPNEPERLRALHALLILDTPPEERFDRVVQFAAEQLDMPIALVSLVDNDRQWFKSRLGIELDETPRAISFCSHAILQTETLLVADTQLDERFADNPFVVGAPHVRFYAGAPLSTPAGHRVGTLCVLDTRPRALDGTELAVLGALRDLVNEAMSQDEEIDA